MSKVKRDNKEVYVYNSSDKLIGYGQFQTLVLFQTFIDPNSASLDTSLRSPNPPLCT
jgi:hypothetical protein